MYRIVNPYLSKNQKKKLKPILLQHGYQNAASTWLINSRGKLNPDGKYIEFDEEGNPLDRPTGNTLGFVLASSGYDVWLPNYRGNIYSLNHTKFDPNKGNDNLKLNIKFETLVFISDKEFWSFSMDEMISYDLPAIIKYIQDKTSRSNLIIELKVLNDNFCIRNHLIYRTFTRNHNNVRFALIKT